jgi:hypothetical protein
MWKFVIENATGYKPFKNQHQYIHNTDTYTRLIYIINTNLIHTSRNAPSAPYNISMRAINLVTIVTNGTYHFI